MANERMDLLRKKAMGLPMAPGVYIMKDTKGEIIYIGKAKVLRNRVSQYFGSQNTHATKVRRMVEHVYDFDYILTTSEFEALILECSLIKQHQPHYNILLKDSKGYCYIKITDEPWRRLQFTYHKVDDGSKYLGPYISSFVVTQSLDAARKIFKLPQCNLTFPCSTYNRRPCLNFHMNQCNAPCCGKVSKEVYDASIDEAIAFLKGGTKEYLSKLEERMERYAEDLEFEKAAEVRDTISAIKRLNDRQKVIFSGSDTEDVFALAREEEKICFHVLRFTEGQLTDSEHFFIDMEDTLEQTRTEMLERFYMLREDIPEKIILDGPLEDNDLLAQWLSDKLGKKVSIVIPQKGRQFELMNMAKSNAYEQLAQTHKQTKRDTAVIELGELLGLPKPPEYIESYDISHTAGADAVGGMVVFKNGVPLKSDYRKFIIKEAEGGDDYGAMHEVLTRRFTHYLEEQEKFEASGVEDLQQSAGGFARLPDLILMDGGLGQVHAAEEVLKTLGLSVPVFGMVKDSKHRTRAITSDGGEIAIAATRKVYTLVTAVQDEVHRFAISFHHAKHSKNARHSELTDIPGIGEKKAATLMKELKTMDAIKRADIDTLAKLPGISTKDAVAIKSYFNFDKR